MTSLLLYPGVNIGLIALAFLAVTASAKADVALPPIFSDHAVLQKAEKVPVWGRARKGEMIAVTLDGATAHTTADGDGKWMAFLNLQDKGPGPYVLTVEGDNKITLKDILVGEVWLCSGQSNMELPLSKTTGAAAEISQSANPMFRQFSVKYVAALDPQDTVAGYWTTASPATSGGFTGVGYYFGKKLQQELKTPVALIHSSWGGTPIEAWVSREALDRDPGLKASRERLTAEARVYPDHLKEFVTRYTAWQTNFQRGDRPSTDAANYAAPEVSVADWKPVQLPGLLAAAGLPDSGAVWLRHSVDVSTRDAGLDLRLDLGCLNGSDTVYWNGVKVGSTSLESGGGADNRRYTVPGNIVKAGTATLAIRLFSPAGAAGVAAVHTPFQASSVPLSGQWLAKEEFTLPPLDAQAQADYPHAPPKALQLSSVPTGCFNGKIDPLIPYALRGVLWYQGEQNTAQGFAYRTALSLLIQDWRARWGEGNLPFYLCQLPNFGEKRPHPGESAWADLRESQATALSLPATGMATLIDVGEQGDIHPKDKRTPGERLAIIALAQTYWQKIPFSGPVYQTLKRDGGKVILHFSHADGGLVARPLPDKYLARSTDQNTVPLIRNSPNSELEGFAVCGADKQWKWADARIEGDNIIVWSDAVAEPEAVRYAWADNPTCNLYNARGLPAAPFRTDDFPTVTQQPKP